jgi:hypothetical protein
MRWIINASVDAQMESIMSKTYIAAWSALESFVEEGVCIQHSGEELHVFSVKDYYEADETCCENAWQDILDDYELEALVNVEDVLFNGAVLATIQESTAYESFVNGQFSQFKDQIAALPDKERFADYIDESVETTAQLKLYRWLFINN